MLHDYISWYFSLIVTNLSIEHFKVESLLFQSSGIIVTAAPALAYHCVLGGLVEVQHVLHPLYSLL